MSLFRKLFNSIKGNKQETSESGAPIYRHQESDEKDFEIATGGENIEIISDHIEEHIGEIESVFHELISDQVHIDVYWVKPSEERPYHSFITSGMSDKPMNVPEGFEHARFTELCICLPPEWEISDEAFEKDENYWPIQELKYLARFPHKYNTWLSYGHTIPNGNPPVPFTENTELNTMCLLPSILFPEEFQTLKLEDKTIDFYSLVPLYQEEVDLKLKEGVEGLFDGFDRYNVNDILDINRINIVTEK